MTSVIIDFIIQCQFVTSLRAGRVMGRVMMIHRSVENPSVFVFITTRQHVLCDCVDIPSPRELEKLANEICAGSLPGTSTGAHTISAWHFF